MAAVAQDTSGYLASALYSFRFRASAVRGFDRHSVQFLLHASCALRALSAVRACATRSLGKDDCFARRKFRLYGLLISALLHVCAGSAAKAQSVAPTDDDAVNDEQAIGEIVVTAQRREQRLSDVPISVEAATGAALAEAGITDSRMLTAISPALSFNSDYNKESTSFAIRGVQSVVSEGGIQPAVGVVMDDVPFARQAEVIMDLADIERIEILEGPQGTLFGKNTTAGVINIIQNRPQFSFGTTFEQTATVDGEYISKAMVNVPISETVSLRTNAYFHNLNPLVTNLDGPAAYGERNWGAQAKLLINTSSETNLLLSIAYNSFDNTMGIPFVLVPSTGALGQIQRAILGAAVGYGVDVINQDNPTREFGSSQSVSVELNHEFNDHLKLIAISGYRKFNDTNSVDVDATPAGVNPGSGFSPNPLGYEIQDISYPAPHVEQYEYWSQEVRLNYSVRGLEVVGGAFYQNYHEVHSQNVGYVLDIADTNHYEDSPYASRIFDPSFALFGDATKEVFDKIKMFGGLRYTWEQLKLSYNGSTYSNDVAGFFNPVSLVNSAPPISTFGFSDDSVTENNVSGRVGIQWEPASGSNIYTSYNRGYKGPAANQPSGLTSSTGLLLAPEIANAYEIGAKERFLNGRLAVDSAIYHQEIQNIQESVVIPPALSSTLLNAGALVTKGFEVNITGRPIDELALNTGLVYNDARYRGHSKTPCGPSATPGTGACSASGLFSLDETQAIGSPEWKLVTSANYSYDLNDGLKVITRLAYTWQSEVQFALAHDPITAQPSFGILDSSLGITSKDGRWQFTVFGNNLTNKFYYSYLNNANGFVASSFGYIPRDFKRYEGFRINFNY